jgi:predicted transcriptional regulator
LNLAELSNLLQSKVYCGEDKMDRQISFVCAGDLMSDILVFSQSHALLVTGLVNLQVIRTAEMLDIAAIVFIAGKVPTGEMLELARKKGIPLLSTKKTMYLCCGLLYDAGMENATASISKAEVL